MADAVKQIRLNNGQIMNIADLEAIPNNKQQTYGHTAYGLAPDSNIVTWIDATQFIDPNWDRHYGGDHPYGYFGRLETPDTRANHQAAIDFILANGTFIWGDMEHGGLYLYCDRLRDSSWTNGKSYAIALFNGYGVSNEDPNIEIFDISDWATFESRHYESMKALTIVRLGDMDIERGGTGDVVYPDAPYKLITGGNVFDANGVPYTNKCELTLYENELNHTYYNFMTAPSLNISPVSEAWQVVPDYISIIRLDQEHGDPNYQVPSSEGIFYTYTGHANENEMETSQNFGYPNELEIAGYSCQGSWAGGAGNLVPTDPNNNSYNDNTGGNGVPSKRSDDIGFHDADQFETDATDTGFVTIYHMTKDEMKQFNAWLWTSFTENWWVALQKVLMDPLDFIISAGQIKYVPVDGDRVEVKFNGHATGVFTHVTRQWIDLDFGSVKLDQQFNSYLDYGTYSSVKIYLPFIGVKTLDTNDVQNATLSLMYSIDNITGACIAVIKVDRSDSGASDDVHINSGLYRFTGNCKQEVPISNKNYANSIEAFASLAGSICSGSGAAIAGNAANMIMNAKPSIERSGNMSSNYGMMDQLVPFLILERPIRSVPSAYGSFVGYPVGSQGTMQLKHYSGYIECITAKIDNIHATDEEKEIIMSLLKSGVYCKEA